MKKKIFAVILILFVAVSAFAKPKKEPLIDFIIDVYNQKEPCSNENFLKHGFVKNSQGFITTWHNLTVQLVLNNSELDRYVFSAKDESTYLSSWSDFITYIYDKYDKVEQSEGQFINSVNSLSKGMSYRFSCVTVFNFAPTINKFELYYNYLL